MSRSRATRTVVSVCIECSQSWSRMIGDATKMPAKTTKPMLTIAIWWKCPTIQSVLCTTTSKAMVALTTPESPEISQLTSPRKSAVEAPVQAKFER